MAVTNMIPLGRIENCILMIRGHNVILDRDLAELYGVSTKVLNQAVRRNIDRFPEDFMFQLTPEEFQNWKSQFVTSNSPDKMGLRKLPTAFTEQGVAMISSVLKSKQAIAVNVAIMRAFVQFRELLSTHKDLASRIDDLEAKYDESFRRVFDAIRQLMAPPATPRNRIGFR